MGIIAVPVRISGADTRKHLEEHLPLDHHNRSVSCCFLVVKNFVSGVTLSGFKSMLCLDEA